MERINSAETLSKMGKKVREKDLAYQVYSENADVLIEIFDQQKKVFEFVCDRKDSREFFLEAVKF